MKQQAPIALITGGAKRIGAAMTRGLAAHGFNVAIHYHQGKDDAKQLADEIISAGGQAQIFQADLINTHGQGLIEEVHSKIGPVSLLVNNASIFIDDHIGDLDKTIWDDHFSLHLRAPAILADTMKRLLPKNQQGLIVNMIDQRVWKLNPQFFSYTLSKSALWTMTQTLAQALAPNIRVNAIGPGPSLKSARQNAEDFNTQSLSVPLQHGPELSEFAQTIIYFWQQKSITGQMIALDGGQHLMWQTPDLIGLVE